MENFTPLASLAGGMLIGLSATLLLLFTGRTAGISSILGDMLEPGAASNWRILFVVGMLLGGTVLATVYPESLAMTLSRTPAAVVAGGLLVGFGTRMGGGCTSGHGVCGISRFSPRSVVATIVFMLTGGLTVLVVNHVLGGAI